ncbi:MAG: T9SS type A sorting domain-containing protein [Flavobacteriales bacterium]|nr:T9SS type A sorting domain-containing protein [Flavobacteriales bacterium]
MKHLYALFLISCLISQDVKSQIPHYDINQITMIDVNGELDSVGVECSISGVVYGIDMSGTSSSSNTFTVIDNTDGISVFKPGGFTPSYTVTEGDSVTVYGVIAFFNGLAQMEPDSIHLHAQNAGLNTPTLVTALGEQTESELIRIDSVELLNPGQWPSVGSNANVEIRTVAGDTLIMRIDKDTDVDDNVVVPSGYFNVVGIGGQFDFSSPYLEGYQVLPRYASDITFIIPTEVFGSNEVVSKRLNMYPNPCQSGQVNWVEKVNFSVFDIAGNLIFQDTNQNRLDVSNFSKGVYIVQSSMHKAEKLIVY